jgi:hypothetical protein
MAIILTINMKSNKKMNNNNVAGGSSNKHFKGGDNHD